MADRTVRSTSVSFAAGRAAAGLRAGMDLPASLACDLALRTRFLRRFPHASDAKI